MTARKYAEGTEVSVAKTRAELDEILVRFGADSVAVLNSAAEALVVFEMRGRRLMFRLKLPEKNADEFNFLFYGGKRRQRRTPKKAAEAWDAACRQKWRSLLLAVKARLVSVEEGVETFEEAFLAHIVLPSGRTVAEESAPRIAQMYKENTMQPLLPAPGGR